MSGLRDGTRSNTCNEHDFLMNGGTVRVRFSLYSRVTRYAQYFLDIHMSIGRWRGGEEELTRTCARFFQRAMGISDYTIGVNDWGVAERSRNTALSFLIDYILIRESNGPYETVARALEIHNMPWYAWAGNDLNRGIYGIDGIPIDVCMIISLLHL